MDMLQAHRHYDSYQPPGQRQLLEDSSPFFWNSDRYNTTSSDNELTHDGNDTATVLVLAILLFILVSTAIACVRMREASQQQTSGLNLASDGRTVASLEEDQNDLEEGGPSKAMDAPIVVVVVIKEDEGEA